MFSSRRSSLGPIFIGSVLVIYTCNFASLATVSANDAATSSFAESTPAKTSNPLPSEKITSEGQSASNTNRNEAGIGESSKTTVVWLDAQEPESDHPEFFGEYLTRELIRQGVLIAAREGLGLSTRDVVLREALPDDRDIGRIIHVSTHATAEGELEIKLWRGKDNERRELWNKRIKLTTTPYGFYFKLIHAMEEASRGELIQCLKQADYDGSPTSAGQGQPQPELEKSLSECSFPSQWLAVREGHAQIRREGESPELLGVLARGYAHLGFMSQYYWGAMCKVFQARSLLYAERLVASRPREAYSFWVRGYARAWVGLHAAALDDFGKADELAKESGQKPPEWVRIAEHHCHYDFTSLRKLAESDSPSAGLARLLAFMDLAQGGGDANVIEAGERTLDAVPEAYIVYDRLCDFGGVSFGHTSTLRGSTALAEHLPSRIAAMRGLPDEIKQRLPSAPGARSIFALFRSSDADTAFSEVPSRTAKALIDSKASREDRSEPSWTVLCRLIQEEDFLTSVRRAQFLKEKLGVPISDFVSSVTTNLADHPYVGWIESMAIDGNNEPDRFREALKRVEISSLYWSTYPFLRDAYSTPLKNHETGEELARRIYRRLDLTALDCEIVLYWYDRNAELIKTFTKGRLPITPYSPRFIAAMAEFSDVDGTQLKTWERDFGQHVWVLDALARRYLSKKEYADAERCLRQRIKLSADQDAFERLADVFKEQGDEERWRTTLEECLKFPDYGLSHAWVRVSIARRYMDKRQYSQARPYAEQAAGTWASWAMNCASECLEALHQWESSEEWVKNDASRYPEDRLNWYFWCRRTGRGDVDSAKALAKPLVDEYSAQNPPAKQDWIAIYHLLSGDRKMAFKAFQAEYEQSHSYWSGLHIILLADEFEDHETRDRVMAFLIKGGIPDRTASTYALAKFTVLLQDSYQSKSTELDLAALDAILDAASENQRMDLAYFAARYLALRGQTEDSKRYLERCYASTEISQLNRTLAAAELIDAGNTADDLKGPND